MDGDRQSLVSGDDATLTGDEHSAMEHVEPDDSAPQSVFSSSPAASVGRGSHNTPTSYCRRRAIYQVRWPAGRRHPHRAIDELSGTFRLCLFARLRRSVPN